MNTKVILVGVGVVGAGALAFYLYTKKKQVATSSPALQPGSTSNRTITPAPAVKQTMWKDKDGNIFELTSTKGKWGYVVKVNGGVPRSSEHEALTLGPDGHMVGADNNGSVFVYKNGSWQFVIRDNKTQAAAYLKNLGVTKYLDLLSGLNGMNAYILS
ncbi:MAG: hypothetical protein ACRC1W_01200 [Shewanella sp.]